ncbi:hypothetical protein ITP53_29040 [Nonomuraea sp. K274]|uniref:Uncharacterized protein n=1 Tax=Nonomuraea cypriaca TaxID=1187855 RepID=A0A931AIF7_9ACTN|nr:hypothetical protein [Nonomuraea cypriaca]MBF8189707.1 hypothetical protein [Nonomuraea cypriaca]
MRISTCFVLAVLPMAAVLLLPAAAWAWPWPRPDSGDPFTMTVDDAGCRSGEVAVRLHNQTRQLVRFDLKADSVRVATGSIPARETVVRHVPVRRGSQAEIEAYSVSENEADTLIDSTRAENDCPWGHQRHGHLPYTGPPADLMGKLATGVGFVVMGAILWWYGSIWPRSAP